MNMTKFLNADAALDEIEPFRRHLPEVLVIRVKVHHALERWELMDAVSEMPLRLPPHAE